MGDLKARLANRVQLTTDGRKAYLKVVAEVDFDADYAMRNKIFATDYAGAGPYSPPKCIGAIKTPIMGNPERGPYKKHEAVEKPVNSNSTGARVHDRFDAGRAPDRCRPA